MRGGSLPHARVAVAVLFVALAPLLQGCEKDCQAIPEKPGFKALALILQGCEKEFRRACSPPREDCRATRCCQKENERCYVKNTFWSECLDEGTCEPGKIRLDDPPESRFPWNCTRLDRDPEGRGCGVPAPAGVAGPAPSRGSTMPQEEEEPLLVLDDLTVAEFLPGPAIGALPALQGALQAVQSPEVLDDLTVAEVAVGEMLLAPGLPSESLPLFNWKVPPGHSHLHMAAAMNNAWAVHYLLDHHNANVDDLDKFNRSALYWGVYSGGPATVRALLQAGAKPNLRDGDGETPAHKIAQGYPGEGNRTELLEMILWHAGSDEPLLTRDQQGKSVFDWAKRFQNAELLTFLEGKRPGPLKQLRYAVRQPGFWSWAPGGLLLGVALGLATASLSRAPEGAKGVPEGAWLLAAEAEVKRSGGWGKRGPLLRKISFIPELIMNVVFIFGHCAHTVNHPEPIWILVYWCLCWWVPAALAFGAREVFENPSLTATTGRGPRMAPAALLHFLRVCFAFMIRFEWPYKWLSIQFNECGTLELGYAPLVKKWTRINVEHWYNYYFYATVFLCILCPFLLYLRSREGEPRADAVQDLAEEISEAGSAAAIEETVEGVDPVSIRGLRIDIAFVLCDVFLDIAVMSELLQRQRYRLFATSLAVFVSTVVPEAIQRDLPHLLHELRSNGTSVTMGFKSDRLLSCFRRERGWEGFFQLALTAYSIPYLAHEPFSFLKAIASMAISVWSIAGHLYTSVDLQTVSLESPWDEVLDGTTSASTTDFGDSSQELEAGDLA